MPAGRTSRGRPAQVVLHVGVLCHPGVTHPPHTMKMSRKKEPTAEEMVSVLQMQAMAWNSEVALPGGGGGGGGGGAGCNHLANREESPGACPASWRRALRCHLAQISPPCPAPASHPPRAGEEHEEPEDEEAPGVVKAHGPVGDERPQRGVQQSVWQAEQVGRHGKAPALQAGVVAWTQVAGVRGRVGGRKDAKQVERERRRSPGRTASPAASRRRAGAV